MSQMSFLWLTNKTFQGFIFSMLTSFINNTVLLLGGKKNKSHDVRQPMDDQQDGRWMHSPIYSHNQGLCQTMRYDNIPEFHLKSFCNSSSQLHLTSFPFLVSLRVSMKLLAAGRQLVGHDCCLWHGEWLSSWNLVFPPSVCHICLLCFVLSLHCKLFRVGFIFTCISEVQKKVGLYLKSPRHIEKINNNQLCVF